MKIVYANQTKGKSYSDDEDRFLLVELAKYGVGKDDTYEKIKRDINEWPAFRFDWFMKSVRPFSLYDPALALILLHSVAYFYRNRSSMCYSRRSRREGIRT